MFDVVRIWLYIWRRISTGSERRVVGGELGIVVVVGAGIFAGGAGYFAHQVVMGTAGDCWTGEEPYRHTGIKLRRRGGEEMITIRTDAGTENKEGYENMGKEPRV